MTDSEDITRLILIGMTGGGKSSLGNSIVDFKQFNANSRSKSATRNCQVGYRDFNGRHLVVVDTPGFFDNRNLPKEEICKRIAESLQTTVPGPHAFLLVLPFQRITEEIKNGWKWISEIFGEHVLNYCIIVFTCLDNLKHDGDTVEEFYQNRIPELVELMDKCGGRYVPFNNHSTDKQEKNQGIQKILDYVDKIFKNNGNQVFQNQETKMITAAAVEIEEKYGSMPKPQADGTIVLLPQIEKIIVEAYIRKPAISKK